MSKRIFTKKQLHKLRAHKGVANCSAKSITFSKEFKASAVKKYHWGLSPSEIFKKSGLDLKIIGRDIPKESVLRWKKIYKEKGVRGLSEARGKNRKEKTKSKKINLSNLTDAEKIKYLETKVAYLKAENDFLARFRAKRAE